ncbi:MAG: CBS domain-containing protein [Oculatellaceae cyanobacterium Prado106]|jgi:CBS domain-containing protein|nr:CBS domain-containing protein [Oculatellaceae cyanobacterium Prado106]
MMTITPTTAPLKAVDVMTKDVATIRPSATIAEAVELMNSRGWSALMVDRRNEQDAYGMITATDIAYKVIAKGYDPHQIRVYEMMTKPCITVNPDLAVPYIARLFAEHGLTRAPVIQGKLLGIVSVTDLLSKSNFVKAPFILMLEEDLQVAIADARQICSEEGVGTNNCRMAWDRVDAIEVELARQQSIRLPQTALEGYYAEFPELVDAAVWENACSG